MLSHHLKVKSGAGNN